VRLRDAAPRWPASIPAPRWWTWPAKRLGDDVDLRVVALGEPLPYDDASFDDVVSSHVLHYLAPSNELPQAFTTDNVAEALGVDRKPVMTAARDGRIKGRKLRKDWHFTAEAVQVYLAGTATQSSPGRRTRSPRRAHGGWAGLGRGSPTRPCSRPSGAAGGRGLVTADRCAARPDGPNAAP
jgi:hypothetical protein